MLAILELNDFQKIIEIDKPVAYIDMYYVHPGSLRSIPEKEKENPSLNEFELERLIFQLVGREGNFLLYKYNG